MFFDKRIIDKLADELDNSLELYKMACDLQYGESVKTESHRKYDRYFHHWIFTMEGPEFYKNIVRIETNISESIFSLLISPYLVDIDTNNDIYKYKVRRKRTLEWTQPYIEVCVNHPSEVIDVLMICEKHIVKTKSKDWKDTKKSFHYKIINI